MKMFNEKTSVFYQTRYCAQEDFSIAVCMKRSLKVPEHQSYFKNYENSKQVGVITKRKYNSKIVNCGSDLFVISNDSRIFSMFEKYSESSENKIVLI